MPKNNLPVFSVVCFYFLIVKLTIKSDTGLSADPPSLAGVDPHCEDELRSLHLRDNFNTSISTYK